MTRIVTIAHGGWTAEIAPDAGGSIASLAREGVAILRPTSDEARRAGDARQMACYPLVPYANRIAHRRFVFAGIEYALADNFPGSPHTLHGVGWRRAWRVEAMDAASCTLALEHRTQGAEAEDWPFAFDARQRFVLGDDGLSVTISVTNIDDRPAPAGIGLHSFFPRRAAQQIAFVSRGAWRNGPDLLPADRVSGGDWDVGAGRAVDTMPLDNDFYGWDGEARMWSDDGPHTTLYAAPAFGVLRVYTPQDAGFFAAEPVSHRADAISHPADADGAMTILAPGETLEGEARFMVGAP